jgi:hypothetical protein
MDKEFTVGGAGFAGCDTVGVRESGREYQYSG